MSADKPVIGVLALQGCVTPHQPHIEAAGAMFTAVKTPAQMQEIDGIILPGGESTTMLKLINRLELKDGLASLFARIPVWGICAGAILMAQDVENPAQDSFGLLPVQATRNAYGRQLDSIYQDIDGYTVSYIRAPKLTPLDRSVEIVAEREGDAVWLRRGPYMSTTFHPEMTLSFPSPMHISFIDMVKENMATGTQERHTA